MAQTVKDKIPFYAFDKQIAYSPRKKGEKVVYKDAFSFYGAVYFKSIDFKQKRILVEADTMHLGKQLLYIDHSEVDEVLASCLLNKGKMYGSWYVYREGRKILLRYAVSYDNLTTE